MILRKEKNLVVILFREYRNPQIYISPFQNVRVDFNDPVADRKTLESSVDKPSKTANIVDGTKWICVFTDIVSWTAPDL